MAPLLNAQKEPERTRTISDEGIEKRLSAWKRLGLCTYVYLGAFGLNRHWGLAFAMRRWDVERVDLAALGKCGSRIGLVSARASSDS